MTSRIEQARELRDRIDEQSMIALILSGKPQGKRSGFCWCGAPVSADDFGVCGPCGRDRGER